MKNTSKNQIVVNYNGEEKLVLLGVMKNDTGWDMPYQEMCDKYSSYLEIVKQHDFDTIKNLKEKNISNEEGYVLKFSNNFRIKVKFQEYCRLHSIVTNVSNLVIWESLRDGKSLDELLDKTPDEWDEWVRKTEKELRDRYIEIELKHFQKWNELIVGKSELSRKEIAEIILSLKGYNSKILFDMVTGKNYSQSIWKMIRPEYSRPFVKNSDDE